VASNRQRFLQIPGVGEAVVEATLAIGDADPAKDEGCALLVHDGVVDDRHRVHQGFVGEPSYLAHWLLVFYQQPYLGIPKGSRL